MTRLKQRRGQGTKNEIEDSEQLKTSLATKIIAVLDKQNLSLRQAEKESGVRASEFSYIRNLKLDRFTADRLISILNKLDHQVAVNIKVKPRSSLQKT